MSKLTIFIVSTLLILGGCQGSYEVSGGSHHSTIVPTPSLIAFNVIDSYGVNTEFDAHIPLEVSPYIDDGFFEISWWVDNRYDGFHDDYQVTFLINDTPQLFRSLLITSNYCGPFERCDDFAYQNCFYHEDLSLTCERPNSNELDATVDISELFLNIPEQLYFILEVCDAGGFNCDVDSWPVLME